MSAFSAYPEYKKSGAEWLGVIPAAWDVNRIKLSVKSAKNGVWGEDPEVDSNAVWCVRVADFDRQNFSVSSDNRTLRTVSTEDLANRSLCQGDLLLEKSGGGEHSPVGRVVRFDHHDSAVCSNFVARVRLREGMDPRYWTYVHAATYVLRLTQRSIKQTSGIQNLDQTSYFNESAPFPPPSEQAAIADFLDRETHQIDELIAKQERLIELLAEKRQAIITQAVTKGLDSSTPTKPSGAQWLGDVPAHWSVPQMGMHAKVGNGSTPNRDTPSYWRQGDIPWLNSSHVNRSEIRDADQFVTSRALSQCHLPLVQPGSLLVGLTGQGRTRGMTSILRFKATINQHVAYISPSTMFWNPDYLLWFMRSSYGQLREVSDENGSTKGALTCAALKQFRAPHPPLAEQAAIVNHISEQVQQISKIVQTCSKAIDLLKERRAALISAAVTGKIDVREGAV